VLPCPPLSRRGIRARHPAARSLPKFGSAPGPRKGVPASPLRFDPGTPFLDQPVYDLRHTFTSHLLANAIPTVEVAAYVGHSTRQLGDLDNTTTRIYQHPTGEYREAALEAIRGYLARLDALRRVSAR
jgi:integrase